MSVLLQPQSIWLLVLFLGCTVNISTEEGWHCDSQHACSHGRFCIQGECRRDGYGLLGHWKFEEDDGDHIFDSSGNTLDGQMLSDVERTVDARRGKVLSFFGANSGLTISNRQGLLDVRSEFSVAAWVKAPEIKGYSCLVCRGWLANDSNDRINLALSSGSMFILAKLVYSSPAKSAVYTTRIPQDWFHLAATYDGAMLRLYLDGEPVGAAPLTGDFQNNLPDAGLSPLTLGYAVSRTGTSGHFTGLLDDVRFDDRAHSGDEIRELFTRTQNPLTGN